MTLKRRNPPYAGTEVDPHKSKVQIENLLRKYGVEGVQWSEIWSQNVVEMKFPLEDEKHRPVLVRLRPPPFSVKRKTWNAEKGHYEMVDAPNWAQSYRLLYNYLKTKLEAVAFGLRDVEEEFLADILVRGPDGREATVKELVDQQIDAGQIRPMLPGGAEPTVARKHGEVVDADYTVGGRA